MVNSLNLILGKSAYVTKQKFRLHKPKLPLGNEANVSGIWFSVEIDLLFIGRNTPVTQVKNSHDICYKRNFL